MHSWTTDLLDVGTTLVSVQLHKDSSTPTLTLFYLLFHGYDYSPEPEWSLKDGTETWVKHSIISL